MSQSPNRSLGRRVLLGAAAATAAATVTGTVVGAGPAHARVAPTGNRSARGPVDEDALDAVASKLDRDLIALRRDIHRHPETAGHERRTARLVASRLRAAGLDVTTGVGGHGVVGVLKSARPGRTVAYRADMDAVPPDDQAGGGTKPAHLCGHDVHTAVGVGVAEVLATLRDRIAGTVMFVFQPAEENLTGAAAMLDDGVFARVRPSEIHALHCGPFPVGQFAVTPGYGLPGLDRGTVTLTGPDATAQAQVLATEISELSTVSRPETSADLEQLIADIKTPGGPLAEFVFIQAWPSVPVDTARAEVSIFYRCWPEERYVAVRQDIRRLARTYVGASVHFPSDPFPAMVCPEQAGLAVQQYLRRLLGRNRVTRLHAAIPFNGEDFALFLDRIPGTFSFLGVRAPGSSIETSSPHFGAFDPDERAIGYGVRAMAGWLARRACSGHPHGR